MEKDIVIVESEISQTKQDIARYIEFLEARISEYNNLLTTLTEVGIKDELITGRIKRISPQMTQRMRTISDVISQALKEISADVSEIESADEFVFPHDLMSEISRFFQIFYKENSMSSVSLGVEIAVDPKQLEQLEREFSALSESIENYPISDNIGLSKGQAVEEIVEMQKQLTYLSDCFNLLIERTETYIKYTRLTFIERDRGLASGYLRERR